MRKYFPFVHQLYKKADGKYFSICIHGVLTESLDLYRARCNAMAQCRKHNLPKIMCRHSYCTRYDECKQGKRYLRLEHTNSNNNSITISIEEDRVEALWKYAYDDAYWTLCLALREYNRLSVS